MVAVLGLLVLIVAVFGLLALRSWRGVERLDLEGTLASGGSGTNWLLVGTDSRAGITADDPNAGVLIGGGAPTGQRSDTILVLRVDDDGARFLSLPRDLLVTLASSGREGRINTAYANGPAELVRTLDSALGLPVHHVVEIDLASFDALVDALGGVTVTFDHPAFDEASGLSIDTAGDVELDGSQALAYVRSRRYTEIVDGVARTDPTGDLGRVARQQEFLRAVLADATATRNPATALSVIGAVADGTKVDDGTGIFDVIGLARRLRGGLPESEVLPTRPFTTSGGAAVLLLDTGADEVLAGFRG